MHVGANISFFINEPERSCSRLPESAKTPTFENHHEIQPLKASVRYSSSQSVFKTLAFSVICLPNLVERLHIIEIDRMPNLEAAHMSAYILLKTSRVFIYLLLLGQGLDRYTNNPLHLHLIFVSA